MDALHSLYVESTTGTGKLVLVSGGLASGKTELLHAFTRYAVEAGALVLTAGGSRAERSVQGGLIDQLFHGSALPATVVDHVSRLVVPDTSDAEDVGADIRHVGVHAMHEICAVLLELAREKPLVIAVDDVQFADSSSLQFLLYLRRRINSARLLIVLVEWERPQPTLPVFHAEVTRRRHHRIRLRPLPPARIADMLATATSEQDARLLAPCYHRLTGGNPLLVNALVDDHLASDPTERVDQDGRPRPVVGTAFGQAVLACLHRWEPRLLDVARAVAVLGAHQTPLLVGRLAGTTSAEADLVLEILTRAGLLEDGRFRHPAAELAVAESLSGDHRASLHVRAAELLYQRGVGAVEVARHFAAADRAAGAWSVGVLREAAEQALIGDDVATAVHLLELALEVPEGDAADRLAVTRVLVRALWRVNPSAASRYLEPMLRAVEAGELGGRDAVFVVSHDLWNGDTDSALARLERFAGKPGLLDDQTAAELDVAYQWFHGSPPARERPQGEAAPSTDDPWVDATQRLMTAWTQGCDPATMASAEHVLRSCRLGETTLEVVATALLVLVHGDQPATAARWCRQLLDEADRRGAVTWQAVLGGIESDVALRRGDPEAAVALARTALTRLPPRSWGVLIGWPLTTLLLADTALGRVEDAAHTLRQRVPDRMFATLFGVRYLHARGHHYLATDRLLAAISDFQACGRIVRGWDVDVPMLVPWRSDLAEANRQLGRLGVARDLARQQLDRSAGLDQRTRAITLRVLAASSDPADRAALLEEAVRCLEEAGDTFLLRAVRADLAAAQRSRAEPTRGGDAPPAGTRTAGGTRAEHPPTTADDGRSSHDTGPEDPAEDAGASPSTSGNEPRAADLAVAALSDSERRVAELAALGCTNREISARLYVTVSTVEQHLTRVYRKLGVRCRGDLPAGLRAPEAEADGPGPAREGP
ncbi:LuxR family transcriptional regulator [Actinoalloteichus sp. AHMU CJ021]|nr:LuxR family transcriptional regulator [Actinoalloteichus sp. AHMU CJ021]